MRWRAPAPRVAPCRRTAPRASARAAPRRPTAFSFISTRSRIMELRQARVLAQRKGHVLEHRVVGEQRAELEQHAHAPAQLVQLAVPQLMDGLASDRSRCRALGFTWPPISRSMVVLPDPLSPMMATTLPRGIVMSMPVSTGRAS